MITGKKFDDKTIASKEGELLKEYYESSDTFLSDALEYYSILLSAFLNLHEDRTFKKLDPEQKKSIYASEINFFRIAMRYAFNKGHETAFSLLLMDSENSQKFDESFFKKPSSKNSFIFDLDNLISEKVYLSNLGRSSLKILLNFTMNNFENSCYTIMKLAKIFFKKGCEIAFYQIKKNIVGISDENKGRSKMLGVPYDSDFSITPAFDGTFAFENDRCEMWDLHWDCTYGFQTYRKSIGRFIVHQFFVKEIKAYANVGALSYKMLNNYFSSNFKDDDVVYLGEINFSLVAPEKDEMRAINRNDFVSIQNALAITLKRKLHVDTSRILVTI